MEQGHGLIQQLRVVLLAKLPCVLKVLMQTFLDGRKKVFQLRFHGKLTLRLRIGSRRFLGEFS